MDSIDLKTQKNYKEITFNGDIIKVKQYLSIEEKADLINVALQKSIYNGQLFDPLYLDAFVKMNILYMYTDIIFTQEERAKELDLFDKCYCSNLIEEVMEAIPAEELKIIYDTLKLKKEEITKYNNSVSGVIQNTLNTFSTDFEPIVKMLQEQGSDKVLSLLKLTAENEDKAE